MWNRPISCGNLSIILRSAWSIIPGARSDAERGTAGIPAPHLEVHEHAFPTQTDLPDRFRRPELLSLQPVLPYLILQPLSRTRSLHGSPVSRPDRYCECPPEKWGCCRSRFAIAGPGTAFCIVIQDGIGCEHRFRLYNSYAVNYKLEARMLWKVRACHG